METGARYDTLSLFVGLKICENVENHENVHFSDKNLWIDLGEIAAHPHLPL